MCWWRWEEIEGVEEDLILSLESIARMKIELPLSQRNFVADLGLHVQLRELGDSGRLEAGIGGRSTVFDARRDGLEYKVKKYERGEWERLVDPTMALARWILDEGGVSDQNQAKFEALIEGFQRTGELDPQILFEKLRDRTP